MRGCVCLLEKSGDVIVLFFFQAEDGIRDWSVTGVQTCALPIYPRGRRERHLGRPVPRRVPAVIEATRIDECLSVRDGHLFVEGRDAVELAETFGTPLYVMSENQLRRNARRVVEAFTARWPEGEVRVLPSIKANFTLAVRAVLTAEGLGCDTFGPGELEAALRTGVDPARISVNGTAKSEPLLERAIGVGAQITLDSVREIALVSEVARRLRRRAAVRFRLRPDYAELE